jgi:UDP-N-acetylglucosamine acyltransferase
VHGLNTIGLERLGYSAKTLAALRQAYKVIFRQNLTVSEALEQLVRMSEEESEVSLFVDFLKQATRGIVR